MVKVIMVVSLVTATNFSHNAPVKKLSKIGQYLATTWTKVCGLIFGGHPVEYIEIIFIHSFIYSSEIKNNRQSQLLTRCNDKA